MSERPPRELLPRPARLLLGATSPGISEQRLRKGVAGKVVIVTGASSGVGEATARQLGRAGAKVLLVARTTEALEALRDEIVAAGGEATVHPTDMGDMEQVERLAADALGQYGHVDVIVSNAGLSIRRWVSDSYERFHDIERTNAVNYLGPARLVMALLPSMRERGAGHIVNIASAGVAQPPLEWTAYIASKTAFETWLRGMAPEALADGVTTTSIHLQIVRSPMLGDFKMWRYTPAMSPDEAASMIGRAIVDRPRLISPIWARAAMPINAIAQAPIERGLSLYARFANPASKTPDSPRARAMVKATVVADEAVGGLLTILGSRAVRPVRPDRLARAGLALRRYGTTPAAAAAVAAELHPHRQAVIDEDGAITFGELDRRAKALAGALHHHFDLRAGMKVAIMGRNHRGFAEAAVAVTRLGCDLVLLNTDYAGPQLADVLERENAVAAVHDEEFAGVFEGSGFAGTRVLMGATSDDPGLPTAEALIAAGAPQPPAPRQSGHAILMTSGTTGTPKGVARDGADLTRLAPLVAGGLPTLSKFKPTPRSGKPVFVAPPLFHMYGLYGLLGAFLYGSPIVITRRYDAEATLRAIADNNVEVLLAVPTMLKRIMDLPGAVRERHSAASLRMVLCGAAPLPPDLATAFMDEFGDILYNGYASTELGSGTIATPKDLRAAPGTVGRAPYGVALKILDDEGLELPRGETGRIFVGSAFAFDGYTTGDMGSKDVIDGLMRSGDVGHLDKRGRLFIDGRDDDMIVSGGENVFPQEVEDLLLAHPAIADAGVVGVSDDAFGQRLAARVVLKDGASATADELRDHVAASLARYKVPRDVEFADTLPRTSTGKLQRRKLVG